MAGNKWLEDLNGLLKDKNGNQISIGDIIVFETDSSNSGAVYGKVKIGPRGFDGPRLEVFIDWEYQVLKDGWTTQGWRSEILYWLPEIRVVKGDDHNASET